MLAAAPASPAAPTRLTAALDPRTHDARREDAIRDAFASLVPDATFFLDARGRITRASAAWVAFFDTDGMSLLDRTIPELVMPEDRDESQARIARAGAERTIERWVACLAPTASGAPAADVDRRVVLGVRAAWLDGALIGYAGFAHVPASPRPGDAPLPARPSHDPLTGLADRALFRERVERALQRHQDESAGLTLPRDLTLPDESTPEGLPSERGHHVAVLFIDLDDFKTVNDSLGHLEGDRLLAEVATRLLKATRGFDLVARLGGDEFGVLLEGMRAEEDARAVIDRITGVLKRPVVLQAREVVVSASLGVAFARDARSADELLRNADVAMYQAKAAGKGRHAEFDHSMHAAAVARLELAGDLRFAVERGELHLLYQPVVDLASGAIVGAEALLRWERPGHGTIAPLAFIPLAEETGLIVPVGRWVLREACAQLARWRATLPDSDAFSMNVNVSGRQLSEPGFVDEVRAAIRDANVPAQRVTLEITESVLVEHASEILTVLHELRAVGVRLAIDDFGTGYSSLGYLQKFPVDVLKIDRSFVNGVTRGGSEAALTRTIVALGAALGLDAVAEGIEQAAQQDALAAIGCQRGQGYLFARPLSVDDFVLKVASGTRPG